MIQYQAHPDPKAAAEGFVICSLEGCMIGGVGKSQEEALKNFIISINRLEAGRQLTVRAILVAEGKAPMPGYTNNAQPEPIGVENKENEPLIIQAGMTPDQFAKLKAQAEQKG